MFGYLPVINTVRGEVFLFLTSAVMVPGRTQLRLPAGRRRSETTTRNFMGLSAILSISTKARHFAFRLGSGQTQQSEKSFVSSVRKPHNLSYSGSLRMAQDLQKRALRDGSKRVAFSPAASPQGVSRRRLATPRAVVRLDPQCCVIISAWRNQECYNAGRKTMRTPPRALKMERPLDRARRTRRTKIT